MMMSEQKGKNHTRKPKRKNMDLVILITGEKIHLFDTHVNCLYQLHFYVLVMDSQVGDSLT